MSHRRVRTLSRGAGVCGIALLIAITGCKKEDSSKTAPPPANTDALWRLAPPDVLGGGVAADGTLATLHGGLVTFLAALDKAPGGAAVAAQVRAKLTVDGVDIADPAALTAIGIDLSKGAAIFHAKNTDVAVLPVVDPKKLVAKVGGSSKDGIDKLDDDMFCKPRSGRYVCAKSAAGLDLVGKGTSPVSSWPAEMRGDIEAYAAAELVQDDMGPFQVSSTQGVRASARLERGGATLRLHVTGTPAGQMAQAQSARSPLVKGLADQAPTGLFILQAGHLWDPIKEKAIAENGAAPLPGGATVKEVLGAVTGNLVGYVLPGPPGRGIFKVGMTDVAPVAKLVAACAQVGAFAPPGVTVAKKGDHCRVTVNPSLMGATGVTAEGLPPSISFEVWAEPGAMVVGVGNLDGKAAGAPPLSPFAAELLGHSWLMAGWGEGSVASEASRPVASLMAARVHQVPAGDLILWSVFHLSELGLGMRSDKDGIHMIARVRTIWSNPAPLTAALERRIDDFVGGKTDALSDVADLARKNPDSPFAHDLRAGPGLAVPAAGLGLVAATAIPAFMKYIKKSKGTEAVVSVHRIFDGARVFAADPPAGKKPSVPGPSTEPTPPLGTCCKQGGKCAPDASLWSKPPWTSLHFSVDDPSYYSYQYQAAPDGKSFTVRALGDLDCDGTYSTFEMKGQLGADGKVVQVAPMARINETE